MNDPYDLQRFVDAQARVYARVCEELRAGAKTSHWMWFIFPQLEQLGSSPTAKRYGIRSREEARAYWEHPLLGPRLKECTELVLGVQGGTALQIFGSIDELKLCSCLTLFELAAPEEPAFALALDRYYHGRRDERTLALLK
jgi:uncharacterized protein (DUF1810 family)